VVLLYVRYLLNVIIIIVKDFLTWGLFGIFNHSGMNEQQENEAKREEKAGVKKKLSAVAV